jgi:hypothetical protein
MINNVFVTWGHFLGRFGVVSFGIEPFWRSKFWHRTNFWLTKTSQDHLICLKD